MTDQIPDKTKAITRMKEQVRQTTQDTECPRCGHWIQEEAPYKNPPKHAVNSPTKLPDFSQIPSTPNNTPITSPCLLPSPTPLLQLRSEDSGSQEKLTITPGKATMNSIHGEATTTAAILGTVAKRWVATKITLQAKTSTATLGTPVQQWEAAKVVLPMTPKARHTLPTIMQTTKSTSSTLTHLSLHHGTSPLNKNMASSIMSSPTSSRSNSPTIPHSECLGNASPSMTLHASASTCAWMALHNDSQEKSKPPTSTTQTWKNCSSAWNGTCVPRPLSIHSMKAVTSKSPIPLSISKEPRSSCPSPVNGNNKANDTDQQQRPSTYASGKKHPRSTYSYSKMTGSPPPRSTTCNGDNTSRNLKTPSGGKYSDKTMLCTTRSSISKDTCI